MAKITVKDLPIALQKYARSAEFAGVEAVTKTALKARKAATDKMMEEFIIRNKWTPKTIRFTPATMERKYAELWVADKYMAEQEEGATRETRPGGVPVPSGIREVTGLPETKVIPKSLRAGAIKGKKRKGMANKPFVTIAKNTLGVWVRETAERFPIKLLYAMLTKPKKIKKRPWYIKPVNKAYDQNIEPEYNKAIEKAIERFMSKYL